MIIGKSWARTKNKKKMNRISYRGEDRCMYDEYVMEKIYYHVFYGPGYTTKFIASYTTKYTRKYS
jgi:hypothetical protein